jgi:hypothetical protein
MSFIWRVICTPIPHRSVGPPEEARERYNACD